MNNHKRNAKIATSLHEATEWEEMFGDETYQDSRWGDPATIRGKIEVARNKVKSKQKEGDEEEEQDHSDHQQRTNESKKSYEKFIKEVRGTTAVFTFGRFNPPTIGHEKLLNVVGSTATRAKAESFVYTSHSQDAKKNPLSNDQKIVFMKMMFPKHRTSFMRTEAKTALHALSEIHKTGKFSKVIMVVGSDRVREFKTLLNKYNNIESKHGFYRFEDIDVISAGERDPDAEGTSGMSASKMRAAVKDKNYDIFKMGVPSGMSEKDCHTLYNAVAKGMKVKLAEIREEWGLDELEEAPVKAAKSKPPSKGLSPSQRRRMAIRMKIMAKKPSFIMKRKRAMKRAATKAKLLMRARKSAIQMVVKKFYPKLKTKSRSELSYAERGKISDIVKKKAGLIARFAKRLVKDKRKQDVERRKSMNKPKEK